MGSKIDRAWLFVKKLGIGFLGTLVEVPLLFLMGPIVWLIGMFVSL